MAYRRRRRRTYSRGPVSRRQLHIVRQHGAVQFTGSKTQQVTDMLATAEGTVAYAKDLTPCTVAGVKGHWTMWPESEVDVTTDQGTIGVALIDESKAMYGGLDTDAEKMGVGPLHQSGRYRRWHYRALRPVFAGGSVDEAPAYNDLANNQNWTSFSVRSNRKIHTVNDSYYLHVDCAVASGHTINFWYDLTLFLMEP